MPENKSKDLHDYVISRTKSITLTDLQNQKFQLACSKTVDENPGIDIPSLAIAAKVYFNLIVRFPDLTL